MPLAPPASPHARRIMREAYDDLNRTIAPLDSRDFGDTTLQHVKKAALEIENQLAARQSLRNMRRLMPLLQGLEHYSKVVDTLCNGTPYLPWIWAPITLVLRIASEYVEAFEQIIKGYASIAASLGRFEILGDTFRGDADFQQALAVFYADMLQFHKHAYRFVRQSSWRLLFLASWGRFQRRFNGILDDMKQHAALIDVEANARNIAEARRMRDEIRAWREQSTEIVSRHEEEQDAQQYRYILSWLKTEESDQLAIFDSISAEGGKYPGTCSWILKHPKVSSWSQRNHSTQVLWMQGTPGSGKSVLSTQLVSFMKAAQLFVVHHFCSYAYVSTTMYEQILKSLLLQLLQKDGELVAHVYRDYVLGKKSPTVPTLEQLLQLLFTSLPSRPCQTDYVWVLIDGLDECELDKQTRLVSLINGLTAKPALPGTTVCKFLISSRASSVLSHRLRRRQIVSLTEEKESLEGAMLQYTHQRLQLLQGRFSQIDMAQHDIEEIQRKIVAKADGMFLYTRLVLDYLASNIFYNFDEVKSSVNQLPEKLSDFYRKIMTHILVQLDPRSVSRVKCLLGWVAFARRPLKKLELLSAIAFSSGDPQVSHAAPRYMLEVCGSLLEERRDTTLSFIHVSVKDFLQYPSSGIHLCERQVVQQHGLATVTCLMSGLEVFGTAYDERARHLRVIKGLHGLQVYATEFWTEYLLSEAASVNGLDTSSPQFALACKLSSRLNEPQDAECTGVEEIESASVSLDPRLELLRPYAALHKHVKRALKARSLKQLETDLLQTHFSEELPRRPQESPCPSDGTSAILTAYQVTLRSLLIQNDYPGVPAEEMDLFKTQFQVSAFTCRLRSCPRATLGFESLKQCLEHEIGHMRRIPCTIPSCQYPPFVSMQALRRHIEKYHAPKPDRKPLRRVPKIQNRGTPPHQLISHQLYPSYSYDPYEIGDVKLVDPDEIEMGVRRTREWLTARQFGKEIPDAAQQVPSQQQPAQ